MSRRKTALTRRPADPVQAAAVGWSDAATVMMLAMQEQLDALKARVEALEHQARRETP